MTPPTLKNSSLFLLAAAICSGLPCAAAHAVVPLDGAYRFVDSAHSPYLIIEQGSLKQAGGFLDYPVCTDYAIQAPAFAAELEAFLQGYPAARIIDQGDGHYLLTRAVEFAEADQPGKIGVGTMYALYAELEFTSATQGTFTLRAATAFFAGEGPGISTCHAHDTWQLQRVNQQHAVLESPLH